MHEARQAFGGIGVWRRRASLIAVAGLVFVWVSTGRPQSGMGSNGSAGRGTYQTFPGRATDMDATATDFDPMMMARRLRALNMERQKEMVSDTNKLLKLARELNAEVAAQKSGNLTADQLRKIAEIEKLARSVKERMTTGIGAPQPMMPPPAMAYPLH